MEEFYLQSNGGGKLHCAVWRTNQTPRAVVQLVHGIAEHIGRYDHFARYLAENGFIVAAEDHMGHGGSIGEDGVKGYFSGGWMTAVADVKLLCEHMKAEYPGLSYYILGHSMGSFLLRTYLYTYPGTINAAIISGTGWEPSAVIRAGLAACKLEQLRLGEKRTSPILTKLMFGSYNKPFAPVRTKDDWICSDPAVVDAYTADPLCGFDATIGLARDMLTGIEMNEMRENLLKMDKLLPLLFVSGGKDPVGGMSKGVLRCIDAFKRAGMRKITIRIYPEGRHEMLNEVNRNEVYQDILNWLLQL
ncbi:MAG: lysophospholipase [Oscillospiraceae bacterium]